MPDPDHDVPDHDVPDHADRTDDTGEDVDPDSLAGDEEPFDLDDEEA